MREEEEEEEEEEEGENRGRGSDKSPASPSHWKRWFRSLLIHYGFQWALNVFQLELFGFFGTGTPIQSM